MDYKEKNVTGDDKPTDGQFTGEEAIAFANMTPSTLNSNKKILNDRQYEVSEYVEKADISLIDLVDCESYHNLADDVITCIKAKAEFSLIYSYSDDDIHDEVAGINEIVIATNDLLNDIANDSQHYKKLSPDSPRMPKLKHIKLKRMIKDNNKTEEDSNE